VTKPFASAQQESDEDFKVSSKRLRIRVQSVKKLQKIESSDSEEPFAKSNMALLPHEVYQQQTDQKAAEKTRK
jgi:hypothetical protein